MTSYLLTKPNASDLERSPSSEIAASESAIPRPASSQVSQVNRQSVAALANVPQTSASTSANPAAPPGSSKGLPYQVNHQVELLNLQAETEALLQELQTIKQRRLVSSGQSEVE
jgi:hypothetical protein